MLYGIDVKSATSLKFEVKACKNVAVYASSSGIKDSSKPLYEIGIGAAHDTAVQIRRRNDASLKFGSSVTTVINIENVLDCNKYRPVSFSLEAGNIMIGSGNVVGEDTIGILTDPDPFNVKCLGVLTLDNVAGEFKILTNGKNATETATITKQILLYI
ncbi:unnamed protein product [Mytilus coruscus]|uniref:Farnesoic acid O-methyl transferase domain-containing protein n=1 Tax=Mytilus coruscus TaxID=42192 RepID=A0A6J8DIG9_MYTCO|nr:unnamed protein product [Mytilus coruscus]